MDPNIALRIRRSYQKVYEQGLRAMRAGEAEPGRKWVGAMQALFDHRKVVGGPYHQMEYMDLLPGLQQWSGNKVARNLFARTFEAYVTKWHGLLELDSDDIRRDSNRVINVGRALDMGVRRWNGDRFVQALRRGGASYEGETDEKTGKKLAYLGPDSLPIFSDVHPIDIGNVGKGTYSNVLTGRAFSATNWRFARKHFTTEIRGNDGEPLGLMPTHMICTPDIAMTAREVFKAQMNAAGATNVDYGMIEVVEIPELITPGADAKTIGTWYLVSDQLGGAATFLDEVDPHLVTNLPSYQTGEISGVVDATIIKTEKYLVDVPARGACVMAPFVWLKITP